MAENEFGSDGDTPQVSSVTKTVTSSYEVKKDDGATNEVWFKKYWRPAIAWTYLAMCVFDFIIFPGATMVLPVILKAAAYTPWVPITLANGGLVHLAMGGIIGVYAWGRTKEKIDGSNE